MRRLPLVIMLVFLAVLTVTRMATVTATTPNAAAVTATTPAISAGAFHTCALKDGDVWCWGHNDSGQLGDGTTTDSSVPVAVSGLGSGVSVISGGGSHTCALKDGGVWCWGANAGGQLGDGTTTQSLVPVAVSGLGSGVSVISAGGGHTCALKDGSSWCWGDNVLGELGYGSTTDSPVPVAVSGLGSGVSAISIGIYHACAVKDGEVWCWGENSDGELGNGTNIGPELCVETVPCSTTPVAVSGLGDSVSAISVGLYHTCALRSGGVWCWGAGGHGSGQLGNGSDAGSSVPVAVSGLGSGVAMITTGGYHTCAVRDGGVSCWGDNFYGELGNGTNVGPELCGGSVGCSTRPVAVSGLEGGVSAISAGVEHTCALKSGGVLCWGLNRDGQLGDGTKTGPQQCGGYGAPACSTTPVEVSGLGPTPIIPSNGDADCNGVVTTSDASFLLAGLGGVPPATSAAPCNDGGATIDGLPAREDANCDGLVNVFDVLAILKDVAGIAPLPASCA
jgi:alpha-tubulin suppressor-like RCC1 family protein